MGFPRRRNCANSILSLSPRMFHAWISLPEPRRFRAAVEVHRRGAGDRTQHVRLADDLWGLPFMCLEEICERESL